MANEWIAALAIVVVTRAIALSGAYLGVAGLMALDPSRDKPWHLELGLNWDAAWYAGIAHDLYTHDPAATGGTSVAFAPLFPFLLWLVAGALRWLTLGWDWGHAEYGATVAAGYLVSTVALLVALSLLIGLLKPRLGRRGATLVAFGVAALPLSLFFSALYTEAVFLMLVVGAFRLAASDWPHKWLCAGLVGMLASLDKFAGALLFPALLVEYLSQRGWRSSKIRVDALWIFLVPGGIALFLIFLWWRFGSPWVLSESQLEGWNHQGSFFLQTYWLSLVELWQSVTGQWPETADPVLYYGSGSRLYKVLDLAMPVILLGGAAVARRQVRGSEWTFLLLGIIYPLSTNITFSLARYTLPLWPGLLWLGGIKGRPLIAAIWFGASLLLLFWCSSIYGGARWIG